ncbi:glucokinase [Paenirhodobacter populi]|uniref:Glucokinase n=1 Tax=Paenirhodobacter populi TaxID=2306993 RepID=A0A443J2T0_9RHOB|nr:glucokinase [Sinirhodobacter populi]RWR14739.1 glucokinase [Sinirhodobacter populi]
MSLYTLLADIGGTNTRVALARDGAVQPDSIRRYPNADYPALEPILTGYMAQSGVAHLAGACVAAAGPVRDGVATMTNLNWVFEEAALAGALRADRVAVLNDLQAQGYALGHLAPDTLREILPGAPARPGASQLVIGIGTGFNAAPVHDGPGGRVVAPSECGQITLPTLTDEEIRLRRFIERQHGFACVEEILSGRGVAQVHAFLRAEAGEAAQPPLDTAAIMAAFKAGDPIAVRTAQLFVRLMGAVVGDLALIHLPFGGIHLIGGVARAFAPWLRACGFDEAFRAKGRFSDFLTAFPVSVIEDDYAALTGCAIHLRNRLREG